MQFTDPDVLKNSASYSRLRNDIILYIPLSYIRSSSELSD